MGFFDLFNFKRSLQDCGKLNGSIDRHSHILYGVDDGIKTAEDALEALKYEEALGIREVWCTPHIMEDNPNETEDLKKRFEELCQVYKGPIKLHLAAEYMMDTVFETRLEAKDILTMEDDMCLVEASIVAPPYDLKGTLADTMTAGYRPLFAHPERCRYMKLKNHEELVKMGVRLQLNIASLTGFYGETAKKKAEMLLKKGLYFAYGSDCHRVDITKQQYTRKELRNSIVRKLPLIAGV